MKTYRAAVIGASRMGGFMFGDRLADAHPYQRPYSHGAGFYASDRTDLWACADLRPEIMVEFGEKYDVPTERQYTDFREMIAQEKPDIVSVATQPENRAEIVIYAAEHGVPAIYAEKALAASLAEADAIVEAVERNGAVLNLGARRRFYPGFENMKQVIDSGEIGALKTLIMQGAGSIFNGGSHILDLTLYLNSDKPAAWVQGHVPDGDRVIQGDTLVEDPNSYHGIIQFENGVTSYALLSAGLREFEAVCEGGTVKALNDHAEFQVRHKPEGGGLLIYDEFPPFEPVSPTTGIIEDLAHSLDTGEPPRGGVRAARNGTELIIAFVESHRRGGARVELPLKDSKLRLQRPAQDTAAQVRGVEAELLSSRSGHGVRRRQAARVAWPTRGCRRMWSGADRSRQSVWPAKG